MEKYELNNDRLKDFSICDEFEIGVNITDDEISEMAKELLDLRKENMALQQTIDRQHETTISDLKLIGKLQQENKEWIEDAEKLATAYKNAVEDIENFALRKGISYLRVAGAKKLLIEHEDLIKKYNNKTT